MSALLGVAAQPVDAQCDPTPRIVWSYPAQGATDVSPLSPILLRSSVSASWATYSFATYKDVSIPLGVSLLPASNLVLDGLIGASLPASEQVSVRAKTSDGGKLDLAFTTASSPTTTPNFGSITLTVQRHWVGAQIDRLSESCRQIVTAPGSDRCWNDPTVQMLGFDARIVDIANAAVADNVVIRAWAIVPVTDNNPNVAAPRIWPVECGPPALLAEESVALDDAGFCVRVLAFVDGPTHELSSSEYCLGGGEAWPAVEPSPELDAGMPAQDAGVQPWQVTPPNGWGGNPPACSPCAPGCFPMACDRIDPNGTGGALGNGANGAGANGGQGGHAASGAGGANAGSGAAPDANGDASSGCGCTVPGGGAPNTDASRYALLLALGVARVARSLTTTARGRTSARR